VRVVQSVELGLFLGDQAIDPGLAAACLVQFGARSVIEGFSSVTEGVTESVTEGAASRKRHRCASAASWGDFFTSVPGKK
jgi:hypothetical protein